MICLAFLQFDFFENEQKKLFFFNRERKEIEETHAMVFSGMQSIHTNVSWEFNHYLFDLSE